MNGHNQKVRCKVFQKFKNFGQCSTCKTEINGYYRKKITTDDSKVVRLGEKIYCKRCMQDILDLEEKWKD